MVGGGEEEEEAEEAVGEAVGEEVEVLGVETGGGWGEVILRLLSFP